MFRKRYSDVPVPEQDRLTKHYYTPLALRLPHEEHRIILRDGTVKTFATEKQKQEYLSQQGNLDPDAFADKSQSRVYEWVLFIVANILHNNLLYNTTAARDEAGKLSRMVRVAVTDQNRPQNLNVIDLVKQALTIFGNMNGGIANRVLAYAYPTLQRANITLPTGYSWVNVNQLVYQKTGATTDASGRNSNLLSPTPSAPDTPGGGGPPGGGGGGGGGVGGPPGDGVTPGGLSTPGSDGTGAPPTPGTPAAPDTNQSLPSVNAQPSGTTPSKGAQSDTSQLFAVMTEMYRLAALAHTNSTTTNWEALKETVEGFLQSNDYALLQTFNRPYAQGNNDYQGVLDSQEAPERKIQTLAGLTRQDLAKISTEKYNDGAEALPEPPKAGLAPLLQSPLDDETMFQPFKQPAGPPIPLNLEAFDPTVQDVKGVNADLGVGMTGPTNTDPFTMGARSDTFGGMDKIASPPSDLIATSKGLQRGSLRMQWINTIKEFADDAFKVSNNQTAQYFRSRAADFNLEDLERFTTMFEDVKNNSPKSPMFRFLLQAAEYLLNQFIILDRNLDQLYQVYSTTAQWEQLSESLDIFQGTGDFETIPLNLETLANYIMSGVYLEYCKRLQLKGAHGFSPKAVSLYQRIAMALATFGEALNPGLSPERQDVAGSASSVSKKEKKGLLNSVFATANAFNEVAPHDSVGSEFQTLENLGIMRKQALSQMQSGDELANAGIDRTGSMVAPGIAQNQTVLPSAKDVKSTPTSSRRDGLSEANLQDAERLAKANKISNIAPIATAGTNSSTAFLSDFIDRNRYKGENFARDWPFISRFVENYMRNPSNVHLRDEDWIKLAETCMRNDYQFGTAESPVDVFNRFLQFKIEMMTKKQQHMTNELRRRQLAGDTAQPQPSLPATKTTEAKIENQTSQTAQAEVVVPSKTPELTKPTYEVVGASGAARTQMTSAHTSSSAAVLAGVPTVTVPAPTAPAVVNALAQSPRVSSEAADEASVAATAVEEQTTDTTSAAAPAEQKGKTIELPNLDFKEQSYNALVITANTLTGGVAGAAILSAFSPLSLPVAAGAAFIIGKQLAENSGLLITPASKARDEALQAPLSPKAKQAEADVDLTQLVQATHAAASPEQKKDIIEAIVDAMPDSEVVNLNESLDNVRDQFALFNARSPKKPNLSPRQQVVETFMEEKAVKVIENLPQLRNAEQLYEEAQIYWGRQITNYLERQRYNENIDPAFFRNRLEEEYKELLALEDMGKVLNDDELWHMTLKRVQQEALNMYFNELGTQLDEEQLTTIRSAQEAELSRQKEQQEKERLEREALDLRIQAILEEKQEAQRKRDEAQRSAKEKLEENKRYREFLREWDAQVTASGSTNTNSYQELLRNREKPEIQSDPFSLRIVDRAIEHYKPLADIERVKEEKLQKQREEEEQERLRVQREEEERLQRQREEQERLQRLKEEERLQRERQVEERLRLQREAEAKEKERLRLQREAEEEERLQKQREVEEKERLRLRREAEEKERLRLQKEAEEKEKERIRLQREAEEKERLRKGVEKWEQQKKDVKAKKEELLGEAQSKNWSRLVLFDMATNLIQEIQDEDGDYEPENEVLFTALRSIISDLEQDDKLEEDKQKKVEKTSQDFVAKHGLEATIKTFEDSLDLRKNTFYRPQVEKVLQELKKQQQKKLKEEEAKSMQDSVFKEIQATKESSIPFIQREIDKAGDSTDARTDALKFWLKIYKSNEEDKKRKAEEERQAKEKASAQSREDAITKATMSAAREVKQNEEDLARQELEKRMQKALSPAAKDETNEPAAPTEEVDMLTDKQKEAFNAYNSGNLRTSGLKAMLTKEFDSILPKKEDWKQSKLLSYLNNYYNLNWEPKATQKASSTLTDDFWKAMNSKSKK
jgi:hypothetical protein